MEALFPAYAGRTAAARQLRGSPAAHPRLRGADETSPLPYYGWKGSSPLTRGGPTSPMPRGKPCTAHPRLRGADLDEIGFMPRDVGSSPLTRGGLSLTLSIDKAAGLIPAYAGRTRISPGKVKMRRAHPRLRGADEVLQDGIPRNQGSSPLTRGGPNPRRGY